MPLTDGCRRSDPATRPQPARGRPRRARDRRSTTARASRASSHERCRPSSRSRVIIVIWQLVFYLQLQPDYIIPGPRQVWDALAHQARAADPVAVDVQQHPTRRPGLRHRGHHRDADRPGPRAQRPLRAIFGPILTGLQVLPSVAWVPAAIIWFGLTDATIYIVVLLGAMPSIANGLIAGIDQIPPIYLRVGRCSGARACRARRIVLPGGLARLPRRPQAGLGVLLALADGGRDHRRVAGARPRPRTDAGHRPHARRHGPGPGVDRHDHGGRHPRRACGVRPDAPAHPAQPRPASGSARTACIAA